MTLLCAGSISTVSAATIFQDGFESGDLGPAWTVSFSNQGRATVTTNSLPASGEWHLVLDDSLDDAVYSVAEATLQLNLLNKKNVLLSFKAKSLGNDPDQPFGFPGLGPHFDGVSISIDGGKTWQWVLSLAYVGTNWETETIYLDDYLSLWSSAASLLSDVRIRFSEYDNASAPVDGIAFDDVLLTADDDQRALLELPVSVVEGGGPYTGYVMVSLPPTNALTLALNANPDNQLLLPTTVNIPPGETSAAFSFSVTDDNLVNLTRYVYVTASAADVRSIPGYLTVFDNDSPIITLTIPPQLFEGQSTNNNASVTLDRAPVVPLDLYFSATPQDELTFPYGVTIAAGQTQAVFSVWANDDNRIDGNVLVTLKANAPGIAAASAQTTTIDNEPRNLSLTLPPSVLEGTMQTGMVSLSGVLSTNFTIYLTNSDPASLTNPAAVVVPVGQLQAVFPIYAPDNTLRDGSRLIMVSASADTFTGTNSTILVRDNEVATYQFTALNDIVDTSKPLNVTVSAADASGNIISGFSGTVNLSVVLSDGTVQFVIPDSVTLSGLGWTGSVTLPAIESAPFRLRASDTAANSGESGPLDIMRTLNLTADDLVWDAGRSRLYASISSTAADTNANYLVAINPDNGQITDRIQLAQNPGQLALTSAGEYLYVSLDGNGTIARLNLAPLAIESSFAVGTSPLYGTLYAADMCTVAGQPNLLVIAQKRKSVTPEHNGVAVYDNGVARPSKTQDHTGSNLIEPSADPTIFFGYNTESTEFGFRRLRLDATGMTEIEVNTSLVNGWAIEMHSDGNQVFFSSGVTLEGMQMRRLGIFPTNGPVRPDLAANRVYFIEGGSPYPWNYQGYDTIAAYDPLTCSTIRKASMPPQFPQPKSFIRWGTNGLAFLTDTNLILVNTSLVPNGPPANLALTIQATPNPATVSLPLVYTLSASNQGPNVARNAVLNASLSDNQTVKSVNASVGTPLVWSSGSNALVTLAMGDLSVGAVVSLTITVSPQSAGSLSCSAGLSSDVLDPDFSDNTSVKLVSVGFESGIDTVNQLRFNANNLIYDPTRRLLWATTPNTLSSPLGKSIVSIDPVSGLISDPIPLNASPVPKSLAISANGRYLYTGLSDATEVCRVDLGASPPASLRIPLTSQWGGGNYAEDIEVLDGDGTSFLMTGSGDHAAYVFDGTIARGAHTGIYSVDRLARTASPGLFVGYNNYTSGFDLSSLLVSASGVSVNRSVSSVISGFYVDITGSRQLVLSSTGLLVDSTNLTLKANLSASGVPCLDESNQRAFLVSGNQLLSFDTATTLSAGNFSLPVAQGDYWAQSCLRWGLDGFAILGTDGNIYIGRWSGIISPSTDSNGDGIPDAWEAAYFSRLDVNLAGDDDGDGVCNAFEWFFGTSPLRPDANLLTVSTVSSNGVAKLRVIFSRRAGTAQPRYQYETSADLNHWATVQAVMETVLSSKDDHGVQVETVEALLPAAKSDRTFMRFKLAVQ